MSSLQSPEQGTCSEVVVSGQQERDTVKTVLLPPEDLRGNRKIGISQTGFPYFVAIRQSGRGSPKCRVGTLSNTQENSGQVSSTSDGSKRCNFPKLKEPGAFPPASESFLQADLHPRLRVHGCLSGLLTRADTAFMFGNFATDFKVLRYNTLCIP